MKMSTCPNWWNDTKPTTDPWYIASVTSSSEFPSIEEKHEQECRDKCKLRMKRAKSRNILIMSAGVG